MKDARAYSCSVWGQLRGDSNHPLALLAPKRRGELRGRCPSCELLGRKSERSRIDGPVSNFRYTAKLLSRNGKRLQTDPTAGLTRGQIALTAKILASVPGSAQASASSRQAFLQCPQLFCEDRIRGPGLQVQGGDRALCEHYRKPCRPVAAHTLDHNSHRHGSVGGRCSAQTGTLFSEPARARTASGNLEGLTRLFGFLGLK